MNLGDLALGATIEIGAGTEGTPTAVKFEKVFSEPTMAKLVDDASAKAVSVDDCSVGTLGIDE